MSRGRWPGAAVSGLPTLRVRVCDFSDTPPPHDRGGALRYRYSPDKLNCVARFIARKDNRLMSRAGVRNSEGGVPTWPFLLGLAVLTVGTACNIGAGRLTSKELAGFPPAIATAYERIGKEGV